MRLTPLEAMPLTPLQGDGMPKSKPKLTVDRAMAGFQILAKEIVAKRRALGERLSERPFETPEEEEARRFGLAEHLLRLICPDPRACAERGCRRSGRCRHLVYVQQKKQRGGRRAISRRPPGAEAARYAVWVYMNTRAAAPGVVPLTVAPQAHTRHDGRK